MPITVEKGNTPKYLKFNQLETGVPYRATKGFSGVLCFKLPTVSDRIFYITESGYVSLTAGFDQGCHDDVEFYKVLGDKITFAV